MASGGEIVGGTILRLPAIQSPNYVAGTTGWKISQDGSAEFTDVTIIVGATGQLTVTDGTDSIVLDPAGGAFSIPTEFLTRGTASTVWINSPADNMIEVSSGTAAGHRVRAQWSPTYFDTAYLTWPGDGYDGGSFYCDATGVMINQNDATNGYVGGLIEIDDLSGVYGEYDGGSWGSYLQCVPGTAHIYGDNLVVDAASMATFRTAFFSIGNGLSTDTIKSNSIYRRTSAASPNVFIATSPIGVFYRSTSSARYKTAIKAADLDPAAVLALQPATFADRAQAADGGQAPRYLGLLAEHVAENPTLGRLLVGYGEDGQPDSVHYDRLAVALLPVLRDLTARVETLEEAARPKVNPRARLVALPPFVVPAVADPPADPPQPVPPPRPVPRRPDVPGRS